MGDRNRFGRKSSCSKCGNDVERKGQAYCNSCHAAYEREHRKKYSELSPTQKLFSKLRSYVRNYVKRGAIVKNPCVTCGDINVVPYWPDTSKPTEVIWYCKKDKPKQKVTDG